jgi:hypothetical protein
MTGVVQRTVANQRLLIRGTRDVPFNPLIPNIPTPPEGEGAVQGVEAYARRTTMTP